MVQSVMLVALGFLLAALISLLVAPVVWKRAARLATERLKASLPISLTDFHAEKDQLRAQHAMQVRGLEVTLEQMRDKSAKQMVELGRQRAEIMALTNQMRELRSALSERKSMTAVMEQTLSANVPRLKERLETEIGAKIGLGEKVGELESVLRKKEHQLDELMRDVKQRDNEILKLRQEISANKHMSSVLRMPKFAKDGAAVGGIDAALAEGLADEKSAAALVVLQQENRRLGEMLTAAKGQIDRANTFEQKELPALRQELRQLGAELLRSASVPKIEAADGRAASGAAESGDIKKAKPSLSERLKTVTRAKNELGA